MAGHDVDLASGLLWGAGVTAVAEHPLDDGRVMLRTDLPPGGIASVREALAPVEGASVRLVDITDDGLDAWRDHAQVVAIGRRLVVRPPWVELDLALLPGVGPDPVVIELDPGRSWGHGAHPTTRLCLAEIERLLDAGEGQRDITMIDIGCGSGALSIAAARLGATLVAAFDLDPAAVDATVANARRNGVADRVRAHLVPADQAADPLASLSPSRRADLIVANIGAAALIELAPALLRHLAPGGTLVVSGLLDPPPPEVAAAFEPRAARVTTLAGWSALTLT